MTLPMEHLSAPYRIKEVFLAPDTHFRVGRTEMVFKSEDKVVEVHPTEEDRFEDLVGASMAMRQVFGVLDRIAPTNLTVLITGETGTGEGTCQPSHPQALQATRWAFVVFDCSAVPENLIESELFGHKRGAFTGAVDARAGVFEMAHKGTIFLDEIGELPRTTVETTSRTRTKGSPTNRCEPCEARGCPGSGGHKS